MKKTLKAYGVYGLMDWQPLLNVGKAKFQPLFSGGGATAYGETPAKYVTSNPVCQHIIESSHYFQSGYITLLYEHNLDENKADENKADEIKDDTNEGELLKEVSFSSLGDASAYLNENFNIPKNKLRTRESIIEVGKDNGIDVKISD
jgi:hypothetical protein